MSRQTEFARFNPLDGSPLPRSDQHLTDRDAGGEPQDLAVTALLLLDEDLDRQPACIRLVTAVQSPASAAARLTKASTIDWEIWPNNGPSTFASSPLRIW